MREGKNNIVLLTTHDIIRILSVLREPVGYGKS